MSALGQYIHLYYKNYQKYGVTRQDESGANSANYSISLLDSRIKNASINGNQNTIDSTIKTLQQRLKLNSSQQISKDKNEWYSYYQQKYINEIYKVLYERAADINAVKGAFGARGNAQGGYGPAWKTDSSYRDLLNRRKRALALLSQIQALITKINTGEQPQSGADLNLLINLFEQYTHLPINFSVTEASISQIEKALGESIYKGAAANIRGYFGEMLVAACDDKIESIANEDANLFMQNAIKGQNRTKILIDKSNLVLKQDRSKHFLNTSSEDGTKYMLGMTQDKVDVQINVNDQHIFASVKNYSSIPGKKVDVQKELNLFSTITFLNGYAENFGNHWLNLHTAHPGKNKATKSNLDDIVKKEVAIEAFSTGNPFKDAQAANVFVAIDSTTGKVFVANIADIINKNSHLIGGLSKIDSIVLPNRKATSVRDRIYNVLNDLHKQKIRVTYKPTWV